MRVPRTVCGIALCSLLAFAGGCAGGGALRLNDVTPEAIPELEAQQQARPYDAAALARLGVAYFRAQRLDDARAAFDTAAARDPRNGLAAVYLGMTAEAQGDFAAARAAYERYLAVSRSRDLRSAARSRLALLSRRQLEFEARQALAAEATLTQAPPEPNTVAVMPFGYSGTNEEIEPLTRGFAQLIVTDLAKSRQVTVLERERMRAMLDEMRLSREGQASTETAARSGRLLRASRVVQGSLTDVGDELTVAAAVVDVSTAGIAAAASETDALSRLFDLEKAIVFSIFINLGIQLTDAERDAINQRPTQNLQAFLAYSRGLQAEDRGDYATAAQMFGQAARLDPSFQAAAQSSEQANDLQAGSQQSVADVDATATQNEQVETGTTATPETRQDALNNAIASTNPTSTAITTSTQTTTEPPAAPDHTAEGSGASGAGVKALIIIRIPRP